MSKQSAKQKWLANSCLHAATSLWRRWNKLQHFCSEGVWLDHCALNILVLYSPLYVSLQPTEPPAFLSDRRPALPLRKPAISLRPVLHTSALRRSTAHCHKREASTCVSATTAWQPALSDWGGSCIAHSVKSAPLVLVPLGWVAGKTGERFWTNWLWMYIFCWESILIKRWSLRRLTHIMLTELCELSVSALIVLTAECESTVWILMSAK